MPDEWIQLTPEQSAELDRLAVEAIRAGGAEPITNADLDENCGLGHDVSRISCEDARRVIDARNARKDDQMPDKDDDLGLIRDLLEPVGLEESTPLLLSGADLDRFLEFCKAIAFRRDVHSVMAMIDEDGLKFRVNGGDWSAGVGVG